MARAPLGQLGVDPAAAADGLGSGTWVDARPKAARLEADREGLAGTPDTDRDGRLAPGCLEIFQGGEASAAGVEEHITGLQAGAGGQAAGQNGCQEQAVSRRLAGRFDVIEFRREFDRKNGRITGRYDASVSGPDPYPDSSFLLFSDPSGEGVSAPVSSAVVDLTTRKLNWRPDGSYELLNGAVERAWDFGHRPRPVESVSELRKSLARDSKMKVLVGHGLFDLATPYFGSKIVLDQLPAFAGPQRVKLVVYPGGHMFYSREASRKAFRAEVEALMK